MSGPELLLVGASHRSAPLGLRECMSLDAARRDALSKELSALERLDGFLLLCTCNRVELYALADDASALERAEELFCKATGLGVAGLERYGYRRRGADVALHLMQVCSGLDSQMIGETEILGQVKQAYAEAAEKGQLCAALHRLFQKSFQAAKWAREHSGVCLGQVSLGAVAVELARRIHGDLDKSRIMVVGSGQVGADVARAMKLRGAGDIVVTSRTAGHAQALSESIGARVIDFSSWKDEITESDIVILCTSSPAVVLSRDEVRSAMNRRAVRPLFLIDLAVPHDVDESVADLSDVFLYSFSDLADMANENMRGRMAEVDLCREFIMQKATSLWEDLQRRVNGACEELGVERDERHSPLCGSVENTRSDSGS